MIKGDRIRIIRKSKGLTQKQLGHMLGFSNNSADIRVTQYETGSRNPKGKTLDDLASALNVNKLAIDIPEINTKEELCHLFFALEDEFGVTVSNLDFELCLTLDTKNSNYETVHNFLKEWYNMKSALDSGEITKEYYDSWRYKYPKSRIKETQRKLEKARKDE